MVHKLVHLHQRNHTPEFWLRVERVMPDHAPYAWLAARGPRGV